MRRSKFLLPLLIVTGLVGLAPIWYQLQKTTLSRQAWIEELATAVKTGIPSVTVTKKPGVNSTKKPVVNSNRLASASRSKQSPQAESHQPVDATIDPEARAALRSFQTTAELSTARLNSEVARQLDVDVSGSSIER